MADKLALLRVNSTVYQSKTDGQTRKVSIRWVLFTEQYTVVIKQSTDYSLTNRVSRKKVNPNFRDKKQQGGVSLMKLIGAPSKSVLAFQLNWAIRLHMSLT